MEPLIDIQNVSKSFGATKALKSVSLDIEAGRIVGLVGPNGAGKTTLLRALTGGINYQGNIRILGLEPRTQRRKLMASTGVIHDVAVLPPWMKVKQVLDYMEGVHPQFDRPSCEGFLATTAIEQGKKIKHLSKGMKTQLHLALVMATETRLLILDEPTHGLDILFRKRLYTTVLDDYFDGDKSILISTHQVEEVEHILSDVIFIRDGSVLLYTTMDDLREKFVQLISPAEKAEEVRQLGPLTEHELFGRKVFLLKDVDRQAVERLGKVQVPSVADVFVALMGGEG
ncbi:MAG: ABC transporter ATP-binding protein [Fidelibacterota bacterium]|nr:MAG: ABC transporter ATP-binding protein [Candidatus Neomarinimicrobiota bacterium]